MSSTVSRSATAAVSSERRISVPERLFYGLIFLAALFVAALGYFAPVVMDEAFTWAELPPLHARFVATLYLFGAVYLLAVTASRGARAVGPAMGGIAVRGSCWPAAAVPCRLRPAPEPRDGYGRCWWRTRSCSGCWAC